MLLQAHGILGSKVDVPLDQNRTPMWTRRRTLRSLRLDQSLALQVSANRARGRPRLLPEPSSRALPAACSRLQRRERVLRTRRRLLRQGLRDRIPVLRGGATLPPGHDDARARRPGQPLQSQRQQRRRHPHRLRVLRPLRDLPPALAAHLQPGSNSSSLPLRSPAALLRQPRRGTPQAPVVRSQVAGM